MAVDRGYVPKKYAANAQRGYDGVLTKISLDKDGQTNIIDICEGTNVADLAYYLGRKRNVNDFHGLGAFLIMNEKFMNKALNGSSRTLFQPVKSTAKAAE
jgi:unsaturated rhamnogalacturonyl hydrolase